MRGWKDNNGKGFKNVFFSTLVITASMGFGRLAYGIILPSMKEGLKLDYTQMGLIGAGHFLGYSIFSIFSGGLTMMCGPRKVINWSMIVISL